MDVYLDGASRGTICRSMMFELLGPIKVFVAARPSRFPKRWPVSGRAGATQDGTILWCDLCVPFETDRIKLLIWEQAGMM